MENVNRLKGQVDVWEDVGEPNNIKYAWHYHHHDALLLAPSLASLSAILFPSQLA